MKSLKEYMVENIEESLDELATPNFSSANPPNVLVMRRISIRQFPDGTYVALYKIDSLDKYVTVPFGTALSASSANIR